MFKFKPYQNQAFNIQVSLFFIVVMFFSGTSLKSQTYRVAVVPQGTSKMGYVDLEGKSVLAPAFYFCDEYTSDGTCIVSKNAKYKKCQLFDRDGKEIIADLDKIRIPLPGGGWSYGYPDGYSDDVLVVYDGGKWGALNSQGKIIIASVFDELTSFENGHALGEKEGKFYLIGKDGKFSLLPPELKINHVWHFSEGLAAIEVKGEKYGFIDTLGNVIIEPQFKKVGYFSGNYAWARNSHNDIGFINKKGEWVVEAQFESSRDMDQESGMAMVKDNFVWVYVDTEGTIHNFKNVGEKIYSFSEGLALGRQGSKLGFINNKGEWVVEPQFDVAHDFKNGFARVEKDNKWGLIDKEGNWVMQPQYRKMGNVAIITD